MKRFKKFLIEYSPQEVDRRLREAEQKRRFEEKLKEIRFQSPDEPTSQTLPGMDLTAELGQTSEKIDAINDPTRGGQTGIFGKPGNTGSNQKPNTPPQTPPTTPPWTPYKPYDKNKDSERCGCCNGKGRVFVPNLGGGMRLSIDSFETCPCCGGSGLKKDAPWLVRIKQ